MFNSNNSERYGYDSSGSDGSRIGKRERNYSVSITNNLDVLREKLMMELSRRHKLESRNLIANANSGLSALGRRR